MGSLCAVRQTGRAYALRSQPGNTRTNGAGAMGNRQACDSHIGHLSVGRQFCTDQANVGAGKQYSNRIL